MVMRNRLKAGRLPDRGRFHPDRMVHNARRFEPRDESLRNV